MKALLKLPDPIHLQIPNFKRVSITLCGCGGTGSQMMSGLGALALALRERDIRTDITFVDPDRVEEKNVGRQLFTRADIGKPKAQVLAERMLVAYGLPVAPMVYTFADTTRLAVDDTEALPLLIGAVDNPAARAAMDDMVKRCKGQLWWLDCGNSNASGQVALGNVAEAKRMKGSVALGLTDRLPAPSLVYPDLVQTPKVKKPKRAASCAELTAAGEQSLMVNRLVAAWACQLLYDFLILREVKWFALAFNASWGGTTTYPLDAPTLARATGLTEAQLKRG